jgi:hypothetical protein
MLLELKIPTYASKGVENKLGWVVYSGNPSILGSLRQEDIEFKANQGYMVNPSQKKTC